MRPRRHIPWVLLVFGYYEYGSRYSPARGFYCYVYEYPRRVYQLQFASTDLFFYKHGAPIPTWYF